MDINHIKKTRNFSLYFKDFFNRRELFYMLVVRDFKTNYKQSIFSYTWLIIQPLLLMIVMTIFFFLFREVSFRWGPISCFYFMCVSTLENVCIFCWKWRIINNQSFRFNQTGVFS